jgi:hypothetical protein
MVQVDAATLTRLEDVLLNKKGNVPLDLRFRALFMLKGVSEEQADDAVEIIAKGDQRRKCEVITLQLNFRHRIQ